MYLFRDREPKRVILEGNVFSNLAPICPRPSLQRRLQVLTSIPFGGLGEGRGEGPAGPSLGFWAVSDPSRSQVPLSHPPQPGNTREDRQHRKWNAVHTGGHTLQYKLGVLRDAAQHRTCRQWGSMHSQLFVS